MFLAASVTLAFVGYFSLKQNKRPSQEVLAVLPDSCWAYFATGNINELCVKLNSQNLIFGKWRSMKEVHALSHHLQFIDSVCKANEYIGEVLKENRVHLAVYSKAPEWLLAFKLNELKQTKEAEEMFGGLILKKEEDLFELKNTLWMGVYQGLILISPSKKSIELAKSNGHKLKDNKKFMAMMDNIGKSDHLQFYIDQTILTTQIPSPKLHVTSLLPAKHMAGEFRLNPNEFIINGNFTQNKSSLTEVLKSQEPAEVMYYDLLPSNTRYFCSMALSDIISFEKALFSKQSESTRSAWDNLNAKALYNLRSEFLSCLDRQIIEFKAGNEHAVCLPLNDTVKITEFLTIASRSDTTINGIKIFTFNEGIDPGTLFNDIVSCRSTHAMVCRNAIYFVSSAMYAQQLQVMINSNGTLANNELFMSYASDNISNEASMVKYITPNTCVTEMTEFGFSSGKDQKEAIDNLSNACVVVTQQNAQLKFRMQLNYRSPSNSNTPNLLWELDLASSSISKPCLFTNHLTGESELAIQDSLNNLYLVSATGNLLWQKQLNERIRSEIYTVDIFKNGKHQLFFNSDNYLHLIDRNGKYVEGYPVKLPSEASNHVSLISYDNDKEVRVFVACKNNTIYNFNLYGVRSEGFKPFRTDAEVRLPVKFVRVGESDYLITIDVEGNIHAFSRKGDARIGFKNKAVENCQDFTLVTTNNVNSSYLYYIDERNDLINKISFVDKKDVIKLPFSISNRLVRFVDANGDKTPDFTAVDGSGTMVADINGFVISNGSKLESDQPVFARSFGTDYLFYTYNTSRSQILFEKNQSGGRSEISASGAPLVTPLFRDGKDYMIYMYENKLHCVLLK